MRGAWSGGGGWSATAGVVDR
jgi:hypothetical protein